MNIVKRESEEDLLMDLYFPNIIKGLDADELDDGKLLDKIKEIDGSGSGLDADMVDGYHASAFVLKKSSLAGRVAVIGVDGDLIDGGNYEEFQIEFNKSVSGDLR